MCFCVMPAPKPGSCYREGTLHTHTIPLGFPFVGLSELWLHQIKWIHPLWRQQLRHYPPALTKCYFHYLVLFVFLSTCCMQRNFQSTAIALLRTLLPQIPTILVQEKLPGGTLYQDSVTFTIVPVCSGLD